MAAPFRALLPALAAFLAFTCRDAQGLRSCTSVNVSAEEGSSKVVITNISSYSKMSSLCKKDSSSSECGAVLIISKDNVNLLDNRFRGHFFIQNNNLVIKNVSKVLTGCYQLATDLSGSCLLQFCLGIPGAEATEVPSNVTATVITYSTLLQSTDQTTVIVFLVLSGTAVLCIGLGVCIYWKRQRKGDRNGPASQFKGVPNSENGSLQNVI